MSLPKKRITLKDLAKILNISQATISNALRGSVTVNNRTRLEVIEAAEKVGYVLKIREVKSLSSINEIMEDHVFTHQNVTVYDIAKILNISAATVSRGLTDSVKVKDTTKLKIREVAVALKYKIDKNAQSLTSNRKLKTNNSTIYDIANKLNISSATVSRALNGKSIVPKKTADRVKKISGKMRYAADSDAVVLGQKKTVTVAIFIAGFSDQVIKVLQGMEAVAKSLKINLVITNCLTLNPVKIKQVSSVLKFADGAIIIPDPYIELELLENKFVSNLIPALCLGTQQKLKYMDTMTIDHYQALYDVTSYLINHNKKTICYIDPITDMGNSRKKDGFKQALIDNQIPFDDQEMIVGGNCIFSSDEIIRMIFSAKIFPEALILVNCRLNNEGLLTLKEAGLETRDSVIVCEFDRGFSNKNISNHNVLVSYDFHDLGEKSMNLIAAKINGIESNTNVPTFIKHQVYLNTYG